jgi:predicted RNA binding protein YcfA (HicA-like mRNA interferase family)
VSIRWPTERIEEALKAGGFKLRRSKKHLVYENAEGRTVTLASTPSDRRTEENVLSWIRRALQQGTEPKEDVDAIIPKQHKKKTGMLGGTKSHGTGFTYITIRQPQSPTISDTERNELRSLLERPAKFHSVFVRTMMDAISPPRWASDILQDAASRPEYLTKLLSLGRLAATDIDIQALSAEDLFVLDIINKQMRRVSGIMPDITIGDFLEGLPVSLCEIAKFHKSAEERSFKIMKRLLHEIAALVLCRASAAEIRNHISQRQGGKGNVEAMWQKIQQISESLVTTETLET